MAKKAVEIFISAISSVFFFVLDFLDLVFCILFQFVDQFLEGNASPCYCRREEDNPRENASDDRESKLSETLYGRKNIFRQMGFLGAWIKSSRKSGGRGGAVGNRWSDCGCDSCVSWMNTAADQRLHVVVKEPSRAKLKNHNGKPTENVIFLHGFLSSSSFWTETVFPNLSEPTNSEFRLFAVDLLGFGKSPKPRDCMYTLRDHLQAIEKSVIFPFKLNYFHLVAHSMGCVIALALAARYSKSVKSITLIAPPYIPCEDNASLTALSRFARKSLWPPVLFGSSFMSWYEHLGRCVCFIVCRNHRTWEWILKLLTRRRNLQFMVMDLTRHTHHSAWHTMHNVICGGAKLMDGYLETLRKTGVQINVIQGSQDQIVPVTCSTNIKMKVPNANVDIITNANHSTVILRRKKNFTRDLENIWASVAHYRTEDIS